MILSKQTILAASFFLSAAASPIFGLSFGFGNPQHPIKPPKMPKNGTDLRILPLGNSITWGYGSSSGNGYRQFLLDKLSPTHNVTYIGSEHAGNMTNNANEGHPGAKISDIAEFADRSLPERPNVILVMAGTNDCIADHDMEQAPVRLGALIDRCLEACPDATVLVAQLSDCLDRPTHARILKFNKAVPGVVKKKAENGHKVAVVNMFDYMGLDGVMDGLHPSDIGYEGMAKAWFDGIKNATAKGWITESVEAAEEDGKEEGKDKTEEL